MNKKLEKIELLNKQNELSLSRLDKPDKKNLYINYIKGKIKYELLDREIVFPDEGKTYVFPLYNFPEKFIPYIKVISYFDTENGNYKFFDSFNFNNINVSYSFRLNSEIDDPVTNYDIHATITGLLYTESYNFLPLYVTLYLYIYLPQIYDE